MQQETPKSEALILSEQTDHYQLEVATLVVPKAAAHLVTSTRSRNSLGYQPSISGLSSAPKDRAR